MKQNKTNVTPEKDVMTSANQTPWRPEYRGEYSTVYLLPTHARGVEHTANILLIIYKAASSTRVLIVSSSGTNNNARYTINIKDYYCTVTKTLWHSEE